MPESTSPIVQPLAPRSLAGIAALRDRAALLAALAAQFGAEIPTTPRFVTLGETTLSCLAPGRYLAAAPPRHLATVLAGIAAVTDQSDQWQGFSVAGAGARGLLETIVPLDLDPMQFTIGDLALTRGHHLDLRLWRVGESLYEIAVARSYAGDLLAALQERK